MIIEKPSEYRASHITFAFAQEPWQINQYWDLRRQIFCEEQHIFEESDRDLIDEKALPIIAESSYTGQLDQVVGIVRIDERSPGVWWGGRLGVAKTYRKLSQFQTSGLFNDQHPIHPFSQTIGGALIFKAVSTALTLGCREFYAHVQEQNVMFFNRMHWQTLEPLRVFGKLHYHMKCNLDFYSPSKTSWHQLQLR
ncbi:MSMEG_0567/Sll0786 family nitrogen starvation N-acetyltransferase [Larkinella insperata]|uniref:MSMEG_0567/Sll0786 family nitrogen starvation N-acetyltransferase n=1 Tax=Larkinella insperata TaxID=332158 RepID=A0ABW3QJ85_9BACT